MISLFITISFFFSNSFLLEKTPPIIIYPLLPQLNLNIIGLKGEFTVRRQDPAMELGDTKLIILTFIIMDENFEASSIEGAFYLVSSKELLCIWKVEEHGDILPAMLI